MVFLSYLSHSFGIFSHLSGYYSCAVGFSAVLFAMKYVLYMRSSGVIHLYGFSVNIKVAAWVELVLISLMNPNASFIGHLAGILAGIVYCHFGGYILNPLSYGSADSTATSSSHARPAGIYQTETRLGGSTSTDRSAEEMRRRRLARHETVNRR
jgi:rhomboid domain-containing protein 1